MSSSQKQGVSQCPYQNAALPVAERVADLLSRMTLEEKMLQFQSEMQYNKNLYKPDGSFDDSNWNTKVGHHRAPAFFAHTDRHRSPSDCVKINNALQQKVIQNNRLGIPSLIHDEACHGAQWCDATCFPQAIGMAATWDEEFVNQVYKAVADEVYVAGIRQVLAPVINVTREPRWGRTQETFGEDPYLSARLGVACVKAFEQRGVVTTPKHFIDNVGEGGRDSYAPITSWRIAREIHLPPFKACFHEGGARSVMPGYNSFDGMSCHASKTLLSTILRDEWGFAGIVASDYGGINGVFNRHFLTPNDPPEAVRRCLAAGVDVQLPSSEGELQELARRGQLDEAQLDRAVARVLKIKFELGLFENPYANPDAASEVVRTPAHRTLALEAARKSMTLLKNKDGFLPFGKQVKRVGVFGPAKDVLRMGSYSGPSSGWQGAGGVTPLQGLRAIAPAGTEFLVHEDGQDAQSLAARCDVSVLFMTIKETEGKDRCRCNLLSDADYEASSKLMAADNIIVSFSDDPLKLGDQEQLIDDVCASGKPVVVVLLNGSPVIMERWIEKVAGVLEAWYPGEQGGQAIAEVLYGVVSPAGRVPMTFPQRHGQLPLYYNHKPTGRKYIYADDDGKPLFPFGFGLSYTTFEHSNLKIQTTKVFTRETAWVSVDVQNTGVRVGDEVVQLYIHRVYPSVVVPVKELKGFRRVTLAPGEKRTVSFALTPDDLAIWDIDLKFVNEPGKVEVMVGASSADIRQRGEFVIVQK